MKITVWVKIADTGWSRTAGNREKKSPPLGWTNFSLCELKLLSNYFSNCLNSFCNCLNNRISSYFFYCLNCYFFFSSSFSVLSSLVASYHASSSSEYEKYLLHFLIVFN